jgi:hypothetical protein
MINPYEVIDRRLSAIEQVLQELRQQSISTPLLQPAEAPPILSAAEVKKMTGWPDGTFYAKASKMPEGVVIRGKSKRLLFDREQFMQWLKTPVQP